MMKGKFPFLVVGFLGIVLDLGTKELAFYHTRRAPGARIAVVHTRAFELDWHKIENSGGMFGVGQQWGGVLRYLRLAALGLVIYFFARAKAKQKLFLTSLALILAGAVGNLYDSFLNNGKVRDFIEVKLHFMPKSIFHNLFDPWPTFNVADSLILIGAFLLVIFLFKNPDAGAENEPQPAASPPKPKERA